MSWEGSDQMMFPEGLKAYQCYFLNHGSPTKVFNCIQFPSFEMSPDFPYFLKRNKKPTASTHTRSRRAGPSYCEPLTRIQKTYSEA